MEKLIGESAQRVPSFVPPASRRGVATAMSVLFPKGVIIRSVQIAGSFAIINGVINALSKRQGDKK